ncbi:hypothetical protein AB6H03_03980 [Citrobacter portucalensis]|uniref:hypothetical protein n=1 Tax=Citrobacter portucalensis TaxID=1639133 RepID=UPI0009CFB85A|nr:hypothetical protein [Citrobacter portucalensis]OPX52424.1 hypothetical protein B5P53_05950 [Citrobacter portucalensis]
MEETNFTPGPWHVSNEGKLIIRDKKWLSHIAFAGYATNDEEFATARLIAAAPELLEALQCLFENYKALADSGDAGNWRLEDEPAGQKALHAIAKALGKDQS